MKLLMRVVIIALLLFVLAACGSGEDAAVVEETGPAEAEAEGEEDSDSADADESTTEEHEADSDEMDEGAEDADDAGQDEDNVDADESHEADSDEDDGLEAGHDEDSDDDAMDDDAMDDDAGAEGELDEDSAAGDSMAAAGEGWGESGTTAQSACDHPYMPLRQGANWTYESAEGPYGWEVTSVEGDMDEATAVILVTIEDVTLEYTWDCAEGEGISSFDFVGQGMAAAFPEMTMELTLSEGVFLPPAEETVPGYSWMSKLEQVLTMTMGEGDALIEATGDISTEQTSTILSVDPVTAAGVTVDGVQVEQISEIGILMDLMGNTVDQTQTLNTSFDMGWGVGIMHQIVQSEFGPAEVELVSFYVP